MKRSAAVEFVRRQINSPLADDSRTIAERVVAALENNQPWDPEEPELPKRLMVVNDGTEIRLVPTDECYSPKMFASAYYPVAADAYNRLQSGELLPLPAATEEILKLIQERDHLNRLLKSERALVNRLEERLANRQVPADVISKTRAGKTVHYAIGPTRETREEAERDLREWFDKEAS